MDNLAKYIEQLLKDKGLPELKPEVHSQLVDELSGRFTQLLNRRLIESLTDEQKLELEKIINEQPPDINKIQNFMAEKIPNTVEITAQAMKEFRGLYLGDQA
jgi:hypothetical protein